MKRYELNVYDDGEVEATAQMDEAHDGEWVKWKDAVTVIQALQSAKQCVNQITYSVGVEREAAYSRYSAFKDGFNLRAVANFSWMGVRP